ncbi:MAG: cell division protein FtsQ/DivIB [Bryobacteraceae bacterium]
MARTHGVTPATAAWRTAALIALPVLALAFSTVVTILAVDRLERFLVESPRFTVRGVRGGLPTLRIEGVHRMPVEKVQAIFAGDAGRSLYLVPIAQRRDSLRSLSWVRDASVARIWPNEVRVQVWERTPVARAQLPSMGRAGVWRTMLVDGEGVLLEPPRHDRHDLPVLAGLRVDQSLEARRERVTRMQELLAEAGEYAPRLSEIDATAPDNLRVTLKVEDKAYVLVLGGDKFAQRLATFFKYYAEIRRRLPDAATLDLRLDDRIAVVKED